MSKQIIQGAGQKWVIVFLIYADFTTPPKDELSDSYVGLNTLFEDIMNTPIDPKYSRIHIILNSITTHHKNDEIKHRDVIAQYNIARNKKTRQNEIAECQLLFYNNYDPGQVGGLDKLYAFHKTESLAAMLSGLKIDNNEKVMIVTWDHGSVFGIFQKPRTAGNTIANEKLCFEEKVVRFPYLKSFFERLDNLYFNQNILNSNIISLGRHLYYLIIQDDDELKHRLLEKLVAQSMIKPELGFQLIGKHICEITVNIKRFKKASAELGFKISDAELELLSKCKFKLIKSSGKSKSREILSNNELANAIKLSLPEGVSVMLMMNCYMMNMHTMYSFREVVTCLVGAQSGITNPGYNYRSILKYINNKRTNVTLTPQLLATYCVNTSHNPEVFKRAKQLNNGQEKAIQEWILAAVDLKKEDPSGNLIFSEQVKLFRSIADGLNKVIKTNRPHNSYRYQIKGIKIFLFDYSEESGGMVDVINFLEALVDGNNYYGRSELDGELLQQIQAFRDMTIVIAEYNLHKPYLAKNSFTRTSQNFITPTPSAYSLFMPNTSIDGLQSDIEQMAKDDPLLSGPLKGWKKFVNKICK